MPRTIQLPNGWTPRRYQRNAWAAWERGVKRSLLVWHRRAGKDDVALHMAAIAAHQRVANYWHCLPEYEQARKAIWDAVNPHTGRKRIDEAFPHELRSSTNSQTMSIGFKSGSTWRVVGSDRPDSLVGASPAGIVFSEWALSNPSAWGYLAPMLLENGGWSTFITTPRGRNHVKSMLDMARKRPPGEWFTEVLTINDTGAITPEMVEQQRAEYHGLYGMDAGDALIEQEYFCSFEAAILGAYWGRELRKLEELEQITSVSIEETQPVHTAWDLGMGDSMAIWFFQVVGREIRIVDWFEAQDHGFEKCRDMKRAKGYSYGHDFVPHDAKVREMGTGRTRIETMIQLGLKPRLVPMHKLEDGINAARQTLARCWFDEDRCQGGLERLRQYKAKWDDDKKCFSDEPLHDWTSHTSDAFRYLSMAWRELAGAQPAPKRAKLLGVGPHNEVTFNDIMPRGMRG